MFDTPEEYIPGQDSGAPPWEQDIRKQFENWLENLKSNPFESKPDNRESPDLYSFYQELSALRMESMKTARRTNESFSNFLQVLSSIENSYQHTNQRIAEEFNSKETERIERRMVQIRPFVELFVRLQRLVDKGAVEPQGGFWPTPKAWKESRKDQLQGLRIVTEHFWNLLANQGVSKIPTMGQVFDPANMMAVAAEPKLGVPPNRVIDEISPGFFYQGELLKIAEVKVAN